MTDISFAKKYGFKILSKVPFDAVKNLKFDNPFNEDNERYKCIFIHVPKCAGISVEEALFENKVGHNQIWKYKLYNERKFNKYFKFTFVRNPWDRLVSAFFFLKNGGINSVDRDWARRKLTRFDSFNEFVKALNKDGDTRNLLGYTHFIPQHKFITDEEEKIAVDYIGRFETLEEDFEVIKNRLNIDVSLPHYNRSNRENYKKYYDDFSRNVVNEIYEKDIKLFNYQYK